MEYIIPYSWFYHPNFIDPLYAQYLLPRNIPLNPFLLNKNEFRDGCQGIYFRKKYSEFPCPPGYNCLNKGIDYCSKDLGNIIGLYNCPFENDKQLSDQISIDFYKNGLQR